MTIVYGYDFSEASIEALPAAAAIASVLGTKLLVVQVGDPRLRTLSSELERALDLGTRQNEPTRVSRARPAAPASAAQSRSTFASLANRPAVSRSENLAKFLRPSRA